MTEPSWYRIDLHLHTPGSVDYQEPRASYLELLQRAEARGLDIIAFTDHNSVAGYAAMEREIDGLEFLEGSNRLLPDEARRLHEYRRLRERILVLPGFEFTATFGFHILGIFPPDTTVRKLEHILLELNIPEEKLDKGASEVGATTDVLRAYETIADAGGLVIGAHVNSTHGIAMIGLGFGGQTKIAYTQDPNLHALEVTDLESTSRRATARFFNGSKPEYPRRMHCIQGSDAHRVARDPQRPEKNLGIGDRATEVFLPQPDFAALKALFASTDFGRTRPARAPEEHPFDPLTAAREEGATIVQAFQEGLGPPQARAEAILRDVVAFANTNGGVIYVGASAAPTDPIRGVEGAAELTELLRAESARQIVPPLTPDVESLQSDDKTVLVVTVPKGTETPYALEPGYIFVRQEGETTLALRDEIVQLVRAAMAPETVGPDPASTLAPRPRPQPRPAPPRAPSAAEPTSEPNREEPIPATGEPAVAPTPPPAPGFAQQVAVRQATAAEQERQQERTPVPRTGVEIIASNERNGLIYHTVRDLRNRRVVRNVTRESARRLWRYAVLQAEQHPVYAEEVRWDAADSRFGYWKGYRQPEGMRRYNLVYREPAGARSGQGGDEAGERLRVFYGVTEEGIDDRWRAVLPPDSELTEIYYDEPNLPGDPPPGLPAPQETTGTTPAPDIQVTPQETLVGAGAQPAPEASAVPEPEPPLATMVTQETTAGEAAAPAPMLEPPAPDIPFPASAELAAAPPADLAEAAVPPAVLPEEEAAADTGTAGQPVEGSPSPRRRGRRGGVRRNKRAAQAEDETATPIAPSPPTEDEPAAATTPPPPVETSVPATEPADLVAVMSAVDAAPVEDTVSAPAADQPALPPRPRRRRRSAPADDVAPPVEAVAPPAEPIPAAITPALPGAGAAAPDDEQAAAPSAEEPPAAPKRRRAPRRAKATAPEEPTAADAPAAAPEPPRELAPPVPEFVAPAQAEETGAAATADNSALPVAEEAPAPRPRRRRAPRTVTPAPDDPLPSTK